MKTSSRLSPETQPRFGRAERDLVLSVAMKVLRNLDDAEDAAQDAMLLAFRHRHSFRGDASFSTWLHRVATTSSLMHLRKQRSERRARVDAFDACVTVPAPEPDPEMRAIAAAQVARARRHLARVGPKLGDVLRMNAEGYTSGEIGAELRITVSTVKGRVYRGRDALRAALDGSSGESFKPPGARARAA